MREDILNEYFEWMLSKILNPTSRTSVRYRRLLAHLHDCEYSWTLKRDSNRAVDGECLRLRFSDDTGHDVSWMNQPSSVLEMLIALSVRMEEIMEDPEKGDCTSQWFWGMVVNLGLGQMYGDKYDEEHIDSCLYSWMHGEYRANGKGGLFTLHQNTRDLRDIDIWYQAMWYLSELVDE